jgi:hypothetical protein
MVGVAGQEDTMKREVVAVEAAAIEAEETVEEAVAAEVVAAAEDMEGKMAPKSTKEQGEENKSSFCQITLNSVSRIFKDLSTLTSYSSLQILDLDLKRDKQFRLSSPIC